MMWHDACFCIRPCPYYSPLLQKIVHASDSYPGDQPAFPMPSSWPFSSVPAVRDRMWLKSLMIYWLARVICGAWQRARKPSYVRCPGSVLRVPQ